MKLYYQNNLINYKKLIRNLRLNSIKEEEKNVKISIDKTNNNKQ